MTSCNSTLKYQRFSKSYENVWEQLNTILKEKNIPVFAVIDHQKNAQNVALDMPKTRVLIFGNPLVGTPLMLDTPDLALELPLKFLVREENGQTMILWHDPLSLATQYHASEQGLLVAQKMSALMQNIVDSINENRLN